MSDDLRFLHYRMLRDEGRCSLYINLLSSLGVSLLPVLKYRKGNMKWEFIPT